ncbi:unnamed protein product [Albugo candida]|uniref:Sm domain-containing protein n=1 Tax=Albugo candida TaxID=65357 RepID=A0A024G9K1_9STRA|nr:unnamed protein product [Albugo candida]|eukprot:CCI43230.1 unnamed protein product [Albugo candida]
MRGNSKRSPTLVVFLKSLVGEHVQIDLKNDTRISGTIQEVVGNMDVVMLDAVEIKPNGSTLRLEEVFVMGKMILFVQIPNHIHIDKRLTEYEQCLQKSTSMYQRRKKN